MSTVSRRQLLRAGIITTAGSVIAGRAAAAAAAAFTETAPAIEPWKNFKIGIASYTFRELSVEETIAAMQSLALEYISIKDFHLPLNSTTAERKALVQRFRNAGITPLSCGNITMENDEANIRNAFEYAKDCSIPTIVCSPHPDSMPILDKMVKEYDIRLAIHNHGPEDKRFPSPYDVWKAVAKHDKRIGLCIDIGHTARAKVNPAEAILKCRERLYDLHFKDIDSTEPDGGTIQAGRGVLDLPPIVRALQKVKYDRLLSVEYERSPEKVLPEVAETVGYLNGLIAALG